MTSELLKYLLLLLLVLLLSTFSCFGQTNVHGSILSITGEPMPKATIDVTSIGPTDIFSIPGKQIAKSDGKYQINFKQPGLYNLTIRGVFHETVTLPIMIYDQDEIEMIVYLVPDSFNDGKHFDKKVYLKWVRVYGNFNNYDYFSGEIFQRNEDGSVSAFIKSDLDTIRYRVNGLSGGSTVLPEATNFAVLEKGFEAVRFNTDKSDSIEIRYDPNEKLPFEFTLPGGLESWQFPMNAFLYFPNPTDKFWVRPLWRVRSSMLSFQAISDTELLKRPTDNLKRYFYESYDWMSTERMKTFRDTIVTDLKRQNLHPQQRSALLISYVGLIEQEINRNRYLTEIGQVSDEIETLDYIFDEIIETVDPRNPIWALNHDSPLLILEQTGYSELAVQYAEQMVRQHADDMVVRNLVLRLIKQFAGNYNDIREMPHYSWIIERYGENNLARRAVLAFREVSD